MTVGCRNAGSGFLLNVREEKETTGDERDVQLDAASGVLHADLRIGANIAASTSLRANGLIGNRGVQILAPGFVVSAEEADTADPEGTLTRPYRNGKDITDRPRGVLVLDPYPLGESELRAKAPAVYQWLLTRAKPERDQNPRASYRDNWWLFGENQPQMRQAIEGLRRYIATAITARHRTFVFLESELMADQALLVIGSEDALLLGTLMSRLHVSWALAAGGRLGVGNDARYNKTRCFETFPFPDPTPSQSARIRDLAEQLDAHRKRQQALHPELTLTGMYNVLEKLRAGDTLTPRERAIHEQGLVSVLRELHDALDAAVFDAYGWSDLAAQLVGKPGATTPLPDKPEAQAAAEEELLRRLVELNAARAAEEARGLVRWLRPDYQNPGAGAALAASSSQAPSQLEAELVGGAAGTAGADEGEGAEGEAAAIVPAAGKLAWPKRMREQVAAVRSALAHQPLTAEAIATRFKRAPRAAVLAVLEALEELGMVVGEEGAYRLQG